MKVGWGNERHPQVATRAVQAPQARIRWTTSWIPSAGAAPFRFSGGGGMEIRGGPSVVAGLRNLHFARHSQSIDSTVCPSRNPHGAPIQIFSQGSADSPVTVPKVSMQSPTSSTCRGSCSLWTGGPKVEVEISWGSEKSERDGSGGSCNRGTWSRRNT
jgi:hypothetical protein